MKKKDYLKNWFIFNFLFHNSHDKFDIQIFVLESNKQNRIMNKQRCCAWVQKEFVITKAQTHGPGYGTVCQCSEPRERKTIRRWFKENVKAKRENANERLWERKWERKRMIVKWMCRRWKGFRDPKLVVSFQGFEVTTKTMKETSANSFKYFSFAKKPISRMPIWKSRKKLKQFINYLRLWTSVRYNLLTNLIQV